MWKKNKKNLSKKPKNTHSSNCFFKKGLASLAIIGLTMVSPLMLTGCSDGKDGVNGVDGTMWYTGEWQPEESQGKVGDFFYDINTSTIYIKRQTGWESQGSIKGENGSDGKDAVAPTITISDDGYWVINGTKINTKATGEDGNTPYIHADGYWYINGTSTGVKAQGEQGAQGNAGKSAYELYKEANPSYTGTLQEWLETLKGQNGINGTDGTDGATWLSGTNDPTSQGKDGDFYINTTSWDVFKKIDGVWTKQGNIKGAQGEQGAQGNAGKSAYELYKEANPSYTGTLQEWLETLKGQNGTNGTDGTDGATWLSGTNDPTSQGKDGDFYINTTSWDVFKKIDGVWTKQGNIKGAQGENGTQGDKGDTGSAGANGATWLTGVDIAGTDESITATIANSKVGDIYFNTSTCDVYTCTAENTWKWLANIKGLQGETGSKGDKGEQGTSWRFGSTIPASSLGNDGDLYVNTTNWYVYIKTNGTWNYQGCLKGEKGDKGNDGASTTDALVYTGFDGYVWQGANRTSIKAASTGTVDENIRENTLAITETMSTYYPGDYLDLTTNQVAIMSSYFPNIGKTQYSGTTISSITIYAEKAGNLYIGTAGVADVINAKRNSLSSITNTTTAYEVVAGKNEIILNLQIGDNETLVIGGNNSVGIYYAQGIPVSDTFGGYAYINGEYNENIIEMTGEYNDTLAIEILVGAWSQFSEVALYSDFKDALVGQKSGYNITLTGSEMDGIILTACGNNETPAPAYQGKTITKIGFIFSDYLTTKAGDTQVRTKVTDKDAIIYAYKVKNTKLSEASPVEKGTYIEKYTLTFKNYTKNTSTTNLGALVTIGSDPWSYTSCNITIGEDELLAFVVGNCDIILITNNSSASSVYSDAYTYQKTKGYYHYLEGNSWIACNPCALPVDIYYKSNGEIITFEENYAKLEAEEAEAIELNKAKQVKDTYTNGKTISFLGDSLTAYAGWSDNSSYNTTLDGYDTNGDETNDVVANLNSYGVTWNGSMFGGISNVNQTWWKQSADEMGMTVLVNNSSSGSKVSGTSTEDGGTNKDAINRCEQLHNDTGDTTINPDIIAVYMGINDLLDNSVTAETFKTSYTSMVEKIIAKYRNTESGTDAKIVVFTLPYIKLMNGNTTGFVDVDRLTAFNNAIKEVGTANGCIVVEVYPNYSWTADDWTEYCITDVNGGLGHPTAKGMDLITDAFIDALYKTYVTNASE